MIKMYCDVCGKVTERNYVRQPLELDWETGDDEQGTDHWKVKVMVLKNGGQPAEICKDCLLKIITKTGIEPGEAAKVKSPQKGSC